MTAQSLGFVGLSDDGRKEAARLGTLSHGATVEMHVRRPGERDLILSIPPEAAALIETLFGHLSRGEQVAVLAEDREFSLDEAARILGLSCPLVAHRMEIGDLPFRYVGKQRRAVLKDILALKDRLDAQRAAMAALADDAVDLTRHYGV